MIFLDKFFDDSIKVLFEVFFFAGGVGREGGGIDEELLEKFIVVADEGFDLCDCLIGFVGHF